MGSALVTLTTKVCPPLETKPLLKPAAAAGAQGPVKSACVAEWPSEKAAKLKTTCPPMGTGTESGEKVRPPAPTETVGTAPDEVAEGEAEAEAAADGVL